MPSSWGWVQISTLHLLMQGRPITCYEQMYVLFEFLKLTNNPHIHGYIVRDRKRIPLLFTPQRVVEGGTTYNLIAIIVNVAQAYGGLFDQNIRERVITFGADRLSAFQGVKLYVIA